MLEQDQVTSRREVAVFVEDAVVRKEALAVDGLDLSARADVAGVVEVSVEVRPPDQDGHAARLAGDALDGLFSRADETRA